eukprot:scaffold99092_cov57-Phaeocystis_antarctica.AAC.1
MREVRDGEAEGEGEGASSARRRESKRAGGRGARPTPPLGDSTKRGDLKNRSKYFEATGLAVLRRDGFASLAPRDEAAPAQLTTRPLSFNGTHLFVNVVLGPAGWLRVEVLPPRGGGDAPLCGFGARDAVPLRGPLDSTRVALPAWRGGVPLSRFAGAAVRPAGLKWCQPSGAPACSPRGAAWAVQEPQKAPRIPRHKRAQDMDLPTVNPYFRYASASVWPTASSSPFGWPRPPPARATAT